MPNFSFELRAAVSSSSTALLRLQKRVLILSFSKEHSSARFLPPRHAPASRLQAPAPRRWVGAGAGHRRPEEAWGGGKPWQSLSESLGGVSRQREPQVRALHWGRFVQWDQAALEEDFSGLPAQATANQSLIGDLDSYYGLKGFNFPLRSYSLVCFQPHLCLVALPTAEGRLVSPFGPV